MDADPAVARGTRVSHCVNRPGKVAKAFFLGLPVKLGALGEAICPLANISLVHLKLHFYYVRLIELSLSVSRERVIVIPHQGDMRCS